ncbi:MAG: DMT family transporter [Pontibacterium sp.]
MLLACGWMFSAILCFCLLAVGARELSDSVSIFQTLFTRSAVGLLIVGGVLFYSQQLGALKTQRLGLHSFRHLAHFAAQYGWFMGLGALPLAQVFAIEFTVPIWTVLIAALFLKEALSWNKALALLLGSISVWVIVQPTAPQSSETLWFSFVVLIAAIFFAIAHTATKALASTEPTWVIVFYMCLVQMLAAAVPAAISWSWPSLDGWLWLGAVSLSALGAHFSLTRAMNHTEVTTVVTLDYLRLPMIALVGVIFYEEAITTALFIGFLLMLLGNYIGSKKQKSPSAQ